MGNVIEAEHLVKRFGALVAVEDASFSVREGEVFGFLGPNGAGKTTTINILCTLLRATGGRATVIGYDVRKQRSEVRRSIGLVFQDTTLDEYLSAEQNLQFHAYAYGLPRDIHQPRMKELLTLLDLWDRRGESIRKYSGGMKRRLEVVRGLLHHPRVLFLDEPSIGLDPQTRHQIWQYLHDVRGREDLTVFLTTLSSFGIVLATRMRSQQAFQVLMQLLIFPMIFVPGVFFPINNVPKWIEVLSKINPLTYGVDAIRQLFLEGRLPAGVGAGQPSIVGVTVFGYRMGVWQEAGVVALTGLVLAALAMSSFNRQD